MVPRFPLLAAGARFTQPRDHSLADPRTPGRVVLSRPCSFPSRTKRFVLQTKDTGVMGLGGAGGMFAARQVWSEISRVRLRERACSLLRPQPPPPWALGRFEVFL